MLNGSVVFVEPPQSMKYEVSAVKTNKETLLENRESEREMNQLQREGRGTSAYYQRGRRGQGRGGEGERGGGREQTWRARDLDLV